MTLVPRTIAAMRPARPAIRTASSSKTMMSPAQPQALHRQHARRECHPEADRHDVEPERERLRPSGCEQVRLIGRDAERRSDELGDRERGLGHRLRGHGSGTRVPARRSWRDRRRIAHPTGPAVHGERPLSTAAQVDGYSDLWSGRPSRKAMRVPLKVPALMGTRPKADYQDRWWSPIAPPNRNPSAEGLPSPLVVWPPVRGAVR